MLAFKRYPQGVNWNSFIRLSGFAIHKLIITILFFKNVYKKDFLQKSPASSQNM